MYYGTITRYRALPNKSMEATKEVTKSSISSPAQSPRIELHLAYGDSSVSRDEGTLATLEAFFCDAKSESVYTSGPGLGPFPVFPEQPMPLEDKNASTGNLSKDRQSYFLRLFCDHVHQHFQILTSKQLKDLYNSNREQLYDELPVEGALLDCMTALGIQYGHHTGLSSRILAVNGNSSCEEPRPGWSYIRRCRKILAGWSRVSLEVLQCDLLVVLFLMHASSYQEAYRVLGGAVRNALSLNLQCDPAEHYSAAEKTLRKRLWWHLFVMDFQCSRQLGKPLAVQLSVITCSLPVSDGRETNSTATVDVVDMNSLSFLTHMTKLAIIWTDIHQRLSMNKVYEGMCNTVALEHCADIISATLFQLDTWLSELSGGFTTPSGYSMAQTNIEKPGFAFELGVPPRIQRQRILLVLWYHDTYIILQRPFIGFATPRQSKAQYHSQSALQHSLAVISIVHQVLSSSDVLYGWPEAIYILWNATTTVLGFIRVSSERSRVSLAIASIRKALWVFETYSVTCASSVMAKNAIQSLLSGLNVALVDLDETGMYAEVRTTLSKTSQQSGLRGSSSPLLTPPSSSHDPVEIIGLDDWVGIENGNWDWTWPMYEVLQGT
jgi:hypothetical protein